MDESKRHSMLTSSQGTDEGKTGEYEGMRSFDSDVQLQDPSLLSGRAEFGDGVTLVILSIFPSLVVQQISNTLAVRQIVPKGCGAFELVWTHVGYEDDDAEMAAIRLKQSNLIGPAGLVSMEDGEAVEIVQRAIESDSEGASYVGMGGAFAQDADHLVTEGSIIGFWENYRRTMDL